VAAFRSLQRLRLLKPAVKATAEDAVKATPDVQLLSFAVKATAVAKATAEDAAAGDAAQRRFSVQHRQQHHQRHLLQRLKHPPSPSQQQPHPPLHLLLFRQHSASLHRHLPLRLPRPLQHPAVQRLLSATVLAGRSTS